MKLLQTIKSILANEYLPIMAASLRDNLPLSSETARRIDDADFGRLNETLILIDQALAGRDKQYDHEQMMSGLIVWEIIDGETSEPLVQGEEYANTTVALCELANLVGAYEMRERAIKLGVRVQAAWDRFCKPYDDVEQDSPLCDMAYDFEIVPYIVNSVAGTLREGGESDGDPVTDEQIDQVLAQLVSLHKGSL